MLTTKKFDDTFRRLFESVLTIIKGTRAMKITRFRDGGN